jgi:hypothetical protein
MADQSDFRRINEPRVEKLVASMKTIMKSANSNKASVEDVRDLFMPVTSRLAKLGPAPVGERLTETPVEIPLTPKPVQMVIPKPTPVLDLSLHSTRATLEAMDAQQLCDLIGMAHAQLDIRLNE